MKRGNPRVFANFGAGQETPFLAGWQGRSPVAEARPSEWLSRRRAFLELIEVMVMMVVMVMVVMMMVV